MEKPSKQELEEQVVLLSNLPKHREIPGVELCLYQGCWHPTQLLPNIIGAQRHFKAQDTDVILTSKPKCGTTWLKSLVYSLLHRTHEFSVTNHPLVTKNPHEVVPFLANLYANENQVPDLSMISPPRIFATHEPYQALSSSIKESGCKIVHIARNPFDVLVSGWYFYSVWNVQEESNIEKVSLETYFDLYCRGMEPGGPHWDHVLGYWKESLERPDKVLFLKYEDLKEDGIGELKKMAKFLGCEISLEEEKQGVIEDVLKLCSLTNLKELEVNKTGKFIFEGTKGEQLIGVQNMSFFRKGEIGDWVNHLSPSMFERLDQLMKDKFSASGLEFKIHPSN